jgi:predicted transcriptional regulator
LAENGASSSLEETEELLFTLSNGDRLKLLAEIKADGLRLTDLAKSLSASVQETSKHLARLVDCKLIEKTSDGTYRTTSYGSLISEILPSLNFVSRHRKYFSTHNISSLPRDLLFRIGQLSESKFQDHVTNVLLECQHLLGMAEEYFSWSIDEPLPWFITKQFGPDTPIRVLLPSTTTAGAVIRARQIVGGRANFRFAEKIWAGIALNEKVAGVVFPDLGGKLDLSSGFIGYSSEFQRWCFDLFEWMWASASPMWPRELEREMSQKTGIA